MTNSNTPSRIESDAIGITEYSLAPDDFEWTEFHPEYECGGERYVDTAMEIIRAGPRHVRPVFGARGPNDKSQCQLTVNAPFPDVCNFDIEFAEDRP